MTEPAPTTAYMREVAERFLAEGARDRQAAKHLASYVLALTNEVEQLRTTAMAVWGSTNSIGDETPDYWRRYGEEIPVVEVKPAALADLGEALGIGVGGSGTP